MSKRESRILASYLNRGSRDLKKFYKKENIDITRAYRQAVHICLENDADDFRVISCNSRLISAGCVIRNIERCYDSFLYIRVYSDGRIKSEEYRLSR